MCLQWGSEIGPFKIRKHLKSGLFEDQISNGPFYKWHSFSHSQWSQPFKTEPFKIWTFLSGFQKFFRQNGVFCADFK